MRVDRVTLRLPKVYRAPSKLETAKKKAEELKRELASLGGYPSSRADSLEKEIKRVENLIKEIESLQQELDSLGGYPKSRADFLKNEIDKKLSEILDGPEERRVTLEQMKKIYYETNGSKIYWDTLRKVESYNLLTSLPTYNDYEINQTFMDELNNCLQTYNINTYERICHFIAQCSVESECGYRLIEQYGGSDPFTYFAHLDFNSDLGNNAKGDGAKYRGAGAIQLTGKDSYAKFSKNDAQVLTDGALYVGKKYFWAAAGYYWSVYKPSTANDDRFNLNKKCDENATVSIITGIVNGNSTDKLAQRQSAYNVCKEVLKNLK